MDINLSLGGNWTPILDNNRTCVLNQLDMMRATDNLYKSAFWLALFMLLLIIFYFWIQPKFKKLDTFMGDNTLRMIAGLNILLLLILLYTNLGLDAHTLKIIQYVLIGILMILGYFLGNYWYRNYKSEGGDSNG